MRVTERQHLIFDADDTLWENNIYFEAVFDEFCDYLGHSSLTPDQVRAELDKIEIHNNRLHGYGALNFGRNLRQCFGCLSEREVTQIDLNHIETLAHGILQSPMQLMDGVAETVAELSERHELTIFTKGAVPEQTAKIERSGLAKYFAHCGIVKEKNRTAYLELAEHRGFHRARTWMIGNSPKSDINPALAAGLNAVHIPHARTWTLEREEITPVGGKLLTLETIRRLPDYF